MASKRCTEAPEPDAKKAKAEDTSGEFQELDAPKDSRSLLKSPVAFHPSDSTINVLSAWGGKVLTPVTEGGIAFLMAGARANVGQKAGRYMFEIKIVQIIWTAQSGQKPKHTLRIGFSSPEADLILGSEPNCVFFDVDGFFSAGSARENIGRVTLVRDVVVAVVLNLDPKSPNCNTLALYKDGVRITEPKSIPEELHGKALYPHINFRSLSVQVNMGPAPLKELPFKCRLLQGASAPDVMVAASKEPKDGVYNVIVPVAFPDEGTFDWVDMFLENNPTYLEISDRKIIEWAKKSGFLRSPAAAQGSKDKPKANFCIPTLDDFSARKVIYSLAPLVPRNYVIVEVKANLIKSERQEVLKRFAYPHFKKVAYVVMGEPKNDFVERAHEKMLEDKQQRADDEWKKRKDLKEKQALMKKGAEEMKLKREKLRGIEGDAKAEKADDDDEPQEMEEEAPIVVLDETEQSLKFRPMSLPDLEPKVLSANFGRFSTPDEDEGFDDIRYEWSKCDEAKVYLRKWILNKKSTMRIDDLKPGDFFKKRSVEFTKLLAEWQEKHTSYAFSKTKGTDLAADADVFCVDDICDVKDGCPLFEHFEPEDWALVQLRYEMHLMLVAFPKDTNDDDRQGIIMSHLQFYYQKYYQKQLNTKAYNKDTLDEVLAMLSDTVIVKDSLVSASTTDEQLNFDIFVRITEEQRRDRQRRIDAGDETVRLNFNMTLLKAN